MRNNKYRVWDKIAKKYIIPNSNMHTVKDGQGISPGIYCDVDKKVFGLQTKFFYGRDLDLEYQQYTGIKDTSPKRLEIFEDDIVKVWHFEEEKGKTEHLYFVEYAGCSFTLVDITREDPKYDDDIEHEYGYYHGDILTDVRWIEIVGNMKENNIEG